MRCEPPSIFWYAIDTHSLATLQYLGHRSEDSLRVPAHLSYGCGSSPLISLRSGAGDQTYFRSTIPQMKQGTSFLSKSLFGALPRLNFLVLCHNSEPQIEVVQASFFGSLLSAFRLATSIVTDWSYHKEPDLSLDWNDIHNVQTGCRLLSHPV